MNQKQLKKEGTKKKFHWTAVQTNFEEVEEAVAFFSKNFFYKSPRKTRVIKSNASHNGLGDTLKQMTARKNWASISPALR